MCNDLDNGTFEHNGTEYTKYVLPYDYCYIETFKFIENLKKFLNNDPKRYAKYSLDTYKLTEVYCRVDQRKVHYRMYHDIIAQELKVTASLCYWLIRCKPIVCIEGLCRKSDDPIATHRCNNINERFGLFMLLAIISKYRKDRGLLPIDYTADRSRNGHSTTTLYEDIMYYIRNRTITQESILVLAEALAKS